MVFTGILQGCDQTYTECVVGTIISTYVLNTVAQIRPPGDPLVQGGPMGHRRALKRTKY
jgi:hypothetical protein